MANDKNFIIKCPRCNAKTYVNMKKCDNCGLIFERLKFASNQEAKRAIINKEKEKVIYTSQFPQDLQRWKVGLLCAFFGFLGLHNIYVGRYLKGAFSFIFSLLNMVFLLLFDPTFQTYIYETWLLIPSALVFYFWFADLFLIGIKKYKVPVALKMPE